MNQKTTKSANVYMLFLMLYQIFIINGFAIALSVLDLNISNAAIQIIFQVVLFLVPFAMYAHSTHLPLNGMMHINKIGVINILLIILIMIFFQPLLSLIAQISALFWNDTVTEQVTDMFSSPLWIVLLATAAAPAICEEITFRGLIYRNIKNHSTVVKILLSSLFFALMHLNPQQFAYTFVAGILLAFILSRTHSVFSAILAHFTLNGTQVIIAYISSKQVYPETEYEFSQILASLAWLNLIALPLLALCIFLFVRHNKKRLSTLNIYSKYPFDSDGEAINIRLDVPVYTYEQNQASIFTWEFWAIIAIYIVYCFIL